jgi:hypothetical protein
VYVYVCGGVNSLKIDRRSLECMLSPLQSDNQNPLGSVLLFLVLLLMLFSLFRLPVLCMLHRIPQEKTTNTTLLTNDGVACHE